MRKRLALAVLGYVLLCRGQTDKVQKWNYLDISPFYGSVLLHNTDISHLITQHPKGFILGWNQKRLGNHNWEARYGYPDTGLSFVYQDMANPTLGAHYGLYGHYNFYLFKRNLQLRIGQGVAYNTNPYDREFNFRNNAYGSHFLSATLLRFNYHKEQWIGNLGLDAGITLLHYSNANVKAPNTSTNTFALNVGFNYSFENQKVAYPPSTTIPFENEGLKYNLILRGGVNESDEIGSGQFGFWVISAYTDKRLGHKSAVQLGADFFVSYFLKEYIRFQSVAFPENGLSPKTDYRRAGIFVGHELFVNKLSLIGQFGVYVYNPSNFDGATYLRAGLKRYFGKNVFGAITLKSHGAAAEALEFGIGVRL